MTYRRTLAALALATLTAFTAFGCANTQTANVSTPKTKIESVDAAKKDSKSNVKSEEIALIRAKLAKHRALEIERLEAYAAAGKFPLNTTSAAPIHQLKDANGTYCAVANLAVKDGMQDAVDQASKTHNDLLFGEVKDGTLYSWILTTGLTQEELTQIQAPAPYVGELAAPPIVPDLGAPPPPVAPSKEQQAKEDLQAHFRAVEKQLVANTDASLDVAARRLDETFGSVALSML